MTQKKRRFVGWLIAGIISAVILLGSHLWHMAGTLLLILKDYRPNQGFLASPFVGWENLQRFFSMPQVANVTGNTVVGGLLAAFFCLALAVPAILGLSRVRSVGLRYGLGALTFLPLLLTQPQLIQNTYALVGRAPDSPLIAILIPFYQALLTVPFLVMGGLILAQCLKMKTGRLLLVTALGVLAAGWFVGVCGYPHIRFLLYNPANFTATDTLLTFSYRQGLVQGGFSLGAVPQTLAALIGKAGLILLAVPALILMKRRDDGPETRGSAAWSLLALPTVGVAALTVLIALLPLRTLLPGVPEYAAEMARVGWGSVAASLLAVLAPLPGVVLGMALAGLLAYPKPTPARIWAAVMLFVLSAISTLSIFGFLQNRMGPDLPLIPVFEMSASVLITALAVGIVIRTAGRPVFGRAVFLSLGIWLGLFAAMAGDPGPSLFYGAQTAYYTIAAKQAVVYMQGGSPLAVAPWFSIVPPLAIAGAVVLIILGTRERKEAAAQAEPDWAAQARM